MLSTLTISLSVFPFLAGPAFIHSVDENLFYKGVDKSRVDPGRLSQSHGMESDAAGLLIEDPSKPATSKPTPSESATKGPNPDTPLQPRYLFHSGNSLLAMTRKHNVGSF